MEQSLKNYYERYRIRNAEPFAIDLMSLGLFELGRYRFLNRRLCRIVTSGNVVVDVGCGLGYVELELSRLMSSPLEIIGVDLSLAALTNAKKKIHQGKKIGFKNSDNIHLIQASAYFLPIKTDYVDAVVSAALLEHLTSDGLAFTEITRILKPSKRFLVFLPLTEDFLPFSPMWLTQKIGSYHRPEGHLRHYDAKMLKSLLKGTNLLSIEYGGLFFSVWVSFLGSRLSKICERFVIPYKRPLLKRLASSISNVLSNVYDIDEWLCQLPCGEYVIAVGRKV